MRPKAVEARACVQIACRPIYKLGKTGLGGRNAATGRCAPLAARSRFNFKAALSTCMNGYAGDRQVQSCGALQERENGGKAA